MQQQQMQRQRASEVSEFRRSQKTQQRCSMCVDSPQRPRHLVVSVATLSYLMLPHNPLVPWHCCIVAMEVGRAGGMGTGFCSEGEERA